MKRYSILGGGLLALAVGTASAQSPKPALDSAWSWGFEGVMWNANQVSLLHRANPWRAWVGTIGVNANSMTSPSNFGVSAATRNYVNVNLQLGYRRWRATDDRIAPWLELGAQGSVQRATGNPTMWAVGPYLTVGGDYFITSRIAVGGSVAASLGYQSLGANGHTIGVSAGSSRFLARLLL